MMKLKFLADVHLGKLAKLLRLLGFDTAYENSYTNAELLTIAPAENRILLSRNGAFAKHPSIQFYLINDEDPEKQLSEVIKHFRLKDEMQPFTRCIVCNGPLEKVEKEKVSEKLQENTAMYFNEFWQCTNCNRIYWKGSHYERMMKLIGTVKESFNR